MGYALAQAAAEAGATVTLVSGPTSLATPAGVARIDVTSAAEMAAAVDSSLDGVDAFVAVAAVADYTPVAPAATKIKKSGAPLTITLQPTVDILATVAARPGAPYCVGFAAETERRRAQRRRKAPAQAAAADRRQSGAGRLRQRRQRGRPVRRCRRASAAADGQAPARAAPGRGDRAAPAAAHRRQSADDGAHGKDRAQGSRRADSPASARLRDAGLGRDGPARVHRRADRRSHPGRSSSFRPASRSTSPIPVWRR